MTSVRSRLAALTPPPGSEVRDTLVWAVLVAVGAAITAIAITLRAHVDVGAAPFTGRYALRVGPGSLLAPVVGSGLLLAVRSRAHERLPWRWLLLLSWLAALAWALSLALVEGGHGLAGPLQRPGSYLHDVGRVGNDPLHFLKEFVPAAAQQTPEARQHPPGGVLLLWALGRAGVHDAVVLGLILTAVGALSVPLVTVAMRSLCHEPAARRLVPLIVLAPYALWLAVSMDAVVLTLGAAFLCCAVLASEHHRTGLSAGAWAIGAGLLLGVAALFSYNVPWLAWSVILVYFVRRRAMLNVVSGAASLVPIWLAAAAGFGWTSGLSAAQSYFSGYIGPYRNWLLWAVLDVILLVIAAGPGLSTAARKIRRTPGWPFLVGAVLAVGFAIVSGLARGEVERAFLPFYPWLLVPAVAPDVRPPAPGLPASAPTPLLTLGLGVATAVVLEAVLRSPW